MRRYFRVFGAVFLLLGMAASPVLAQDAPAKASPAVAAPIRFPVERLPERLRARAETILLKMMDSEALYTVIGGVKPMSGGYYFAQISVEKPSGETLEETRQILAVLRDGDRVHAELMPFTIVNGGKRYVEAVVFCRPAVRAMVATYADFFAPLGVTESTDPLAIALMVERDPTTARNRGLGYLYGYPKHAVDFFVASADQQGADNKLVPRDFFQIPAFARATGAFVYAVPKGYAPQVVDTQLRARAEAILAEYRVRREKFVGPGKPGIVVLLREWLAERGN